MSFAIAQLRHLYAQMLRGEVKDPFQAATRLLGPAIEALEYEQSTGVQEVVKKTVDETITTVIELLQKFDSREALIEELESIRDNARTIELPKEPHS